MRNISPEHVPNKLPSKDALMHLKMTQVNGKEKKKDFLKKRILKGLDNKVCNVCSARMIIKLCENH